MPSREEYLKWARETSIQMVRNVNAERIEAFGNRVWNEAIEAAAEKATRTWEYDAVEAIRNLKQGETK